MFDSRVWSKAWHLLDASARRQAAFVVCVCGFAALTSVLMVSSVIPFLTVLANTDKIETNHSLNTLYTIGGFSDTYPFLVSLGVVSIVTIVFSNTLQIVRSWSVARFSYMQMHTLSETLMAAHLKLPYESFLDMNSANINTKILSESQEAVNQFFRPASELVAALLTVLAIIIFVFWLYPQISIFAFAILTGLYWCIHIISRRSIGTAGAIRAEKNRIRFQVAQEAFAGIKEIKISGCERSYLERFSDASEKMSRTILFIQIVGEIPLYFMQAVGFGGLILIAVLSLDPDQIASGDTISNLFPMLGVFAFAGQKLLPELSRLHSCLTKINAGSAAVETLYDTHSNCRVAASQHTSPVVPLRLNSSLALSNITYRYPNSGVDIFNKLSLTIAHGEKVGVIGTTGAGKTTLVDIILGLLKPSTGQIKVDGSLINDCNVRSWQKSVAYVPQDIFLADASVAQNIAFGVPSNIIDQERVRSAASVAKISNFIENELPKGYSTCVGERGTRLSGGQRQRIGIARAIYNEADLIIFDEATSALDSQTETVVMDAINSLSQNKTIILIAHRLRTIRECDKIILLNKGKVDGVGSWDSLLLENQLFRNLTDIIEY